MTHRELVVRAERWLRNTMHSRVVLTEQPSGSGEIADAIGFKASHSILVECKTSVADFIGELKNKPWRQEPARGMGTYRWIMCERGVIHPGNLEYMGVLKGDNLVTHKGWGLLYVEEKRVHVVVKATRVFKRNLYAENRLLSGALAHVACKVGASSLTQMMKWGAQ